MNKFILSLSILLFISSMPLHAEDNWKQYAENGFYITVGVATAALGLFTAKKLFSPQPPRIDPVIAYSPIIQAIEPAKDLPDCHENFKQLCVIAFGAVPSTSFMNKFNENSLADCNSAVSFLRKALLERGEKLRAELRAKNNKK